MCNYKLVPLLLLSMGCQKSRNSEPKPSEVKMIVNSPRNGQTFGKGDTISILANVEYSGQLHGCEVKIIDTTSGFIFYDGAQHIHSEKFVINEKWLNELTSPASLKVAVIAYIDHNGNTVQQERYIYVN